MTKEDAIKKWVNQEMSGLSQDWVERLFESFNGYAPKLPMWGTMWICSEFDGEKFMKNSRRYVSDVSEIEDEELRERIEKEVEDGDWTTHEQYVDEEMYGERCILDADGDPTSVFLYELDGEYIIGVHGAGWDFYDGVWDRLYDVAGLQWHSEEK